MAGKSKSTSEAKDDLELHHDAWARFERAADAAVKSGPKHKITKKKATVKPTNGVISKKPLVNV